MWLKIGHGVRDHQVLAGLCLVFVGGNENETH